MTDNTDTHDTVVYRGEIDREAWHEFKRYVPRTITLDEKINELIQKWTEEQKERERKLEELENSHELGK